MTPTTAPATTPAWLPVESSAWSFSTLGTELFLPTAGVVVVAVFGKVVAEEVGVVLVDVETVLVAELDTDCAPVVVETAGALEAVAAVVVVRATVVPDVKLLLVVVEAVSCVNCGDADAVVVVEAVVVESIVDKTVVDETAGGAWLVACEVVKVVVKVVDCVDTVVTCVLAVDGAVTEVLTETQSKPLPV